MESINLRIVLFLTITLTKLSKSDDLIIAKQDIVHATSGIILRYKSDYRPENKTITLSTVIPMIADMCYLIPISALKKLPRCNLTNNMVNFIHRDVGIKKKPGVMRWNKRFFTDIISIGIGSVALSLATMNTIQTTNLKDEMKTVTESLETLQKTEYTHKAQILRLTKGQLKLAMELNNTQQAVNRTMQRANEHSDAIRNHDEAIRRFGAFSVFINNKLNAFMHTVESHFLHISIEDIPRGKLNLHFIHHNDIPKVIELIIRPRTVRFQFLSKKCLNSSVPIKEVSQQFSSYQRTVSTVQFLSKNCVDSSVPIKELCRQFSSYQRTVSTVQFLSKNCVDSSVPIKELCRQFSSYQRTVSTVQFLSKNCLYSSVPFLETIDTVL